MDKVILVGGFHEILELCEENHIEVIGIIDNFRIGTYFGCPIIGKDDDAMRLFTKYKQIPIIITPDSPNVREKLVNHYKNIGYRFYTLVSPRANVSKYAKIGEGSIIQAGANISANSVIGQFVKINTNANIMHDCYLEDFVTIAPNSVILGGVKICKNAYVGANSTILPGKQIGASAVVGAGAVVTKDVINGTTVIGSPARIINKHK